MTDLYYQTTHYPTPKTLHVYPMYPYYLHLYRPSSPTLILFWFPFTKHLMICIQDSRMVLVQFAVDEEGQYLGTTKQVPVSMHRTMRDLWKGLVHDGLITQVRPLSFIKQTAAQAQYRDKCKVIAIRYQSPDLTRTTFANGSRFSRPFSPNLWLVC